MSSLSTIPGAPSIVPPAAPATITIVDPAYIETEALRYLNGPAAHKADQLLGLLE